MVAIHVKVEDSDDVQFVHECSSNSTTDDVIHSINTIFNLQFKIRSLSLPLRTNILTHQFKEISPEVAMVLDRILSEAETYASEDQVRYGRTLSAYILRDHIRSIEKEVGVACSKGLIDGGILQLISDHRCHEDCKLWWAGKELVKGKKLSEYIGENDKTKIIIRLKPVSPNQQHQTIST